jgi:DNA-binding NarL/FixJ family response regulator
MAGLRILLVDDHAAFRDSAVVLLESEGCTVVASVGSGEDALAAMDDVALDVVLLDLYLPGLDGVEVAERMARKISPPAVILISSHDDAAYESRVETAPVRGFLPKRDLACAAITRLLA